MDKSRLYSLKFEIKNIKSYYGNTAVNFNVNKPINVIVGPNGEGKSNLLEAMLYGMANYIRRSPNLKSKSSFFKDVILSKSPQISANFFDMIFTDLVKKG